MNSNEVKTSSDKAAVYQHCDFCQNHSPHLHYFVTDNDPPECATIEEMIEKVKEERICYHESFGKDGFGSERTNAETYLSDDHIKNEALYRFRNSQCKFKLEKVACRNVFEIKGDKRFLANF